MIVRPERIRVRLRDAITGGAVPLELPQREMWPAGLLVGAMFAIFAGVAWTVVGTVSRSPVRDVFDLMFLLFQGFWLLGWSVGVLILGTLTVFLFSYGESARLQQGRLLYVPRLGPLKIIIEYDLARVRNVRLEDAGTAGNVRVRFDADEGSNTLGDAMPRGNGERLVEAIRGAVAAAGSVGQRARAPERIPVSESTPVSEQVPGPEPDQAPPSESVPEPSTAGPVSLSGLALIAANLLPLAGVLFVGWDLATVMMLYWAESAVIGFYTALKMVIVGKVFAIFGVPFFIGHYGGFMSLHFLFIYLLFVRGLHPGQEPGVRDALLRIFVPLWPSLAALFISHGVSFFSNFLGRREYEHTTMSALMAAPYNRIMVMQLTLIFGGWVILLLKNPVPALAVLVAVKTALDFSAHRKEHQKRV